MRTLARGRDKAALLRRLREVRPESARRWGRMSAHQMVVHLADGFRMALGRKPVARACGPLSRSVVKWLALYAPLPWPAGVATSPEIDQACGGTAPAEFATDVAQLETLLEQAAAPDPALDGQAHPVFGPMSAAAWLRWGYRHVDHHLRQFGA